MNFNQIKNRSNIFLYAGDVPKDEKYRSKNPIGLSLHLDDDFHITHDITKLHPLPDNSVDTYQAEDVFEHINYNSIKPLILDIYRILKPSGLFRLSVPDYRCDVLYERSIKNENGDLLFDPDGGGVYRKKYRLFGKNEIKGGGHVWFPKYELVNELIKEIPFSS